MLKLHIRFLHHYNTEITNATSKRPLAPKCPSQHTAKQKKDDKGRQKAHYTQHCIDDEQLRIAGINIVALTAFTEIEEQIIIVCFSSRAIALQCIRYIQYHFQSKHTSSTLYLKIIYPENHISFAAS